MLHGHLGVLSVTTYKYMSMMYSMSIIIYYVSVRCYMSMPFYKLLGWFNITKQIVKIFFQFYLKLLLLAAISTKYQVNTLKRLSLDTTHPLL